MSNSRKKKEVDFILSMRRIENKIQVDPFSISFLCLHELQPLRDKIYEFAWT